jgi:phospholipase/carboxylesterase
MLTRRDALTRAAKAGGALALAALVPACKRTSPSGAAPGAPAWPRTTTHAGVEFLELFPNGADERSPLIVAIHGRGGRPEDWADAWRSFPKKAQIALPRAFDPFGPGYSWFEFRDGMTDEQFGAEVGRAEARLWPAVAELAAGRRPIVTGFSQGGFLSYAMASRHPVEVAAAFPLGGSCPGPLLPKDRAPAAPIVAFHGTDDRVVAIKWGRAAVRGWKERGARAELREYPGVGHAITRRMRDDLFAAIEAALPGASAPAPTPAAHAPAP